MAKPKIKVNMISESAFNRVGGQAHGVHTAFIENYNSLKARPDVDIEVNSKRPADIIHIQTVGPYSLGRMLFGQGCKAVSAHVTPDSFVGSLVGARYWYPLAKLYLRWFYNRADGVFAVSQEVADELKKLGVQSRIYLMPNTINTEVYRLGRAKRAEVRQRLGFKDDEFVVLGVGQVQPRKRIDTFMKVAEQLPSMHFVWVGGIPFTRLADSYEKMKQLMEYPPANVKFPGIIPLEKVHEYYAAADAFFLPSDQETFGLVVVEGAASGLPVVLRDIDQYKKTFAGMYLAGTDDTFAGIFRKLAARGEFYNEAVEKASKIAEKYDSKAGAQRLVEAYEQIVENCRG